MVMKKTEDHSDDDDLHGEEREDPLDRYGHDDEMRRSIFGTTLRSCFKS